MENFEAITQSLQKQAAVLGHAIQDKYFLAQCNVWGVKTSWFLDPFNQKLWDALAVFSVRHSRQPTSYEVQGAATAGEDTQTSKRIEQTLSVALDFATKLGQDGLASDLKLWATGRTIMSGIMTELQPAFKRGDIQLSKQIIGKLDLDLNRIEQIGQTTNRFESSAIRVLSEEANRIEDAKHTIPYGIKFLDDALGCMMRRDVILIGSKSGAGKTQLVTNIARRVAEGQKRVAFFALEAEDREIEMRMKYSLISRAYFAQGHPGNVHIEYGLWRQNRLQYVLGQYSDDADRYMKGLEGLRTYYRTHGDFTVETLEREISKVAEDSDLIILDHIHYIDTGDSDNENAEMKKTVKKLRDLALNYGKPILVVAHLRKSEKGKYQPLLPTLEDFHGSSDLVKICTTAIVLGPAEDIRWTDNGATENKGMSKSTRATYVAVRKTRLEGDRIRYAAICPFDQTIGTYGNNYALGRFVSGGTHWEPVKRPFWAKHGSLGALPTKV